MLGTVFDRFIEKSPISVMVRGTLERVLGAAQLDTSFPRTAQKPYTRTVLFSTVYDILSQVVFRIKPSVRATYCGPAHRHERPRLPRGPSEGSSAALCTGYQAVRGTRT